MASFDSNSKTGMARFFFRFGGQQYNKTLPVKDDREADRLRALFEETTLDLTRGKLILPPDADPCLYILSGGKVTSNPQVVSDAFQSREIARPSMLLQVLEIYATTLTAGSKEMNSLESDYTSSTFPSRPERRAEIRIVRDRRRPNYVDTRAREGVGRETIRKEPSTLRVVWGWSFRRKHIATPLAWKISELTFPKSKEKSPFQT